MSETGGQLRKRTSVEMDDVDDLIKHKNICSSTITNNISSSTVTDTDCSRGTGSSSCSSSASSSNEQSSTTQEVTRSAAEQMTHVGPLSDVPQLQQLDAWKC